MQVNCPSHAAQAGHNPPGPESLFFYNKILAVTAIESFLGRLGNSGVWEGDYGWGVRVRRHLAHAEGVLYGMELGSVTLKRIGFFCFPIKHSTHTPYVRAAKWGSTLREAEVTVTLYNVRSNKVAPDENQPGNTGPA
jgi:hypothetical protein